jgi:hypothetical protein
VNIGKGGLVIPEFHKQNKLLVVPFFFFSFRMRFGLGSYRKTPLYMVLEGMDL